MEGNREEMVSCLHLSGICLNGRSRSLEIGQGCVFSGTRSWWGWMSDVWTAERSQVFLLEDVPSPFPSPSPRPRARDAPRPAAGGRSEVVCGSQPKEPLTALSRLRCQLIRWKLISLAPPCSGALPQADGVCERRVHRLREMCLSPSPSGFGAGGHRAQSF